MDDLIGKMSEPQGRFLLISGASGSGKSSLVAAGLKQAVLKEGRLPGSTKWVWLRITPGDGKGPFDSLAWGLKQTFPRISHKPGELAYELAEHLSTLKTLLTSHLTSDQDLLLFVDQLEELFTQGFKNEDIWHFLAHLVATSLDPQNRLRVVTTVRSEFIGKLEESEPILQVLNAGYNYHLGPVSTRILEKMIERPAQATDYEFEPHLVDEILGEVGKEPGSLPLVTYTLKQLFERRQGRAFTREAYQTMGGVAGAIGTKADQVMETLGVDTIASFDKVFAELVHLERDRPPTRKRVPLTVFRNDQGAIALIQALAGSQCRVLVTGGEERDTTVEVAHEKLFTAWPKLKTWIDDGGDSLRLIDYAEEAATRWHVTGGHLQELWLSRRAEEILKALNQFSKNPTSMLEGMLRPQQMLIARLEDDALSHEDRLLIGKKLAEFGDSRPGVGLHEDGLPDIAWIEIPPGQIQLGDHPLLFEVKPFHLAQYPVTNVQFDVFINAEDGYRKEKWWQGMPPQSKKPFPPKWHEANCPREMVSWYEAMAFCSWLSIRTGTPIRLPTEWEWQQAARGGSPTYEYPWPGGWNGIHCNSRESQLDRTTAVGIYPKGATKQGILDMAGNVYEWCLNFYDNPERAGSFHPDYLGESRVVRGGSWDNFPRSLNSAFRFGYPSVTRNNLIGFRLAQDIE